MTSFTEGRRLVEARGVKWYLKDGQIIDDAIRTLGYWEPWSTVLFEQVVEPGMHVVDVGANVGYYTMLAAKLTGPTGFVTAFEPSVDACSVLFREIEVNGFRHVRVVPVACSDHELFADPKPVMPYSFGPATETHGKVNFVTLDGFLSKLSVGLLKVDTDGYDREVVRGAQRLLREDRPLVLIEVCDYTLRAQVGRKNDPTYVPNTEARALLADLEALGYYFVGEQTRRRIADVDAHLLTVDLATHSMNVLAVPAEREWPWRE